MLKVKLARFGKQHQPHFRVVLIEARDKRDGKYVESLGFYAPTQTPKLLQIDLPKYDEWLKKGAQPTPTVASLVEHLRSNKPFEKKKKLSKKAQAKLAKPKEEASAPVAEVKAVEPEVAAEPEVKAEEVAAAEPAVPAEAPSEAKAA